MFSDPVIAAAGLGKSYQLYNKPQDRLKQFLWRGRKQYYKEFWALHDVNFELRRGEVLGIVGRNGAGKSTLLQLICGTLTPSVGSMTVNGRIAALLELGAGFNPEFTGRENVFMNAAILGVPESEIAARFDVIVDFSGIRDFIDQPVKTYSSGMYMRLAFSIATSIDPDILVIDEALSVGDGQFAHKSFDRIMALKDKGATILFCSHSMYQVEALCNRVLWLEGGAVRGQGEPTEVIRDYVTFLDQTSATSTTATITSTLTSTPAAGNPQERLARITKVDVSVDGEPASVAQSGKSQCQVMVEFTHVPGQPCAVAVGLYTLDGRCVLSSSTINDGLSVVANAAGAGRVTIEFNPLLLLRGVYVVRAWLLDETGLFAHEEVTEAGRISVEQTGLEQGLIAHPHRWVME